MHPIEHLRYVARTSEDISQTMLTIEAAYGLADLGYDPIHLVMACRRLLQRHRSAGALWTLASRICVSDNPQATAAAFAQQLRNDPTDHHISHALDELERQGLETDEIVLIEAAAAGPSAVLAPAGSAVAATAALKAEAQVWVVVEAGRSLPAEMFEALTNVLPDNYAEILPLSLTTHVARPHGVRPTDEGFEPDCTVAVELLANPLT